jgi:hypothetical protein
MSVVSFVEVINALNPLGYISECYANTLNYKLETRKLVNELENMRLQASLFHAKIDAEYNLRMELLSQRRIAIETVFRIADNDLMHLRIERTAVLEMAERAQEQAFRKDISIELSRHFAEMSTTMIQQLHLFGDRSSESLQRLFKALPTVDLPPMLEGPR